MNTDAEVRTWRKSSDSNAGQCIEVVLWRASSRSSSNGGQNCVEASLWRKRMGRTAIQGQCVKNGATK
jgi:hypothetical protein